MIKPPRRQVAKQDRKEKLILGVLCALAVKKIYLRFFQRELGVY
jgi:hypothetical protein